MKHTRSVRLECYITDELRTKIENKIKELLSKEGMTVSVSTLVNSILTKELSNDKS